MNNVKRRKTFDDNLITKMDNKVNIKYIFNNIQQEITCCTSNSICDLKNIIYKKENINRKFNLIFNSHILENTTKL